VFVVLAALCWGLSGGIGGIHMAGDWDTFVVSFYRGAIGLLFFFPGWHCLLVGVDWQTTDYGSGQRLPVWSSLIISHSIS
jgi:hypothetical protein